jgi:WD40 repeat protein
VGCFAVHPSREFFAVGDKGNNPNIYIYSYPGLQIVKILKKGTEKGFAAMSFNAKGDKLASLGMAPDYLLTVWVWEREAIVLHAKAFGQDIFTVAFSPDNPGKLMTSGTGHIRFWKMANTFTGLKLQGDIGKFGKVELSDIESFAILPDAKALSSTESGALLLWEGNFIKLRCVRKKGRPCHSGHVSVVTLERQEGRFVTAGQDGWIRWWDFATIDSAEIDADKSMDFEIEPLDEACVGENVAIKYMIRWTDAEDPSKDRYLIQDLNGGLWSYNIAERKAIQLLNVPGGALVGLDSSPLDHFAATAGVDGAVRCWDYVARRQLYSMRFNCPASCLRWAPTTTCPKGRTVAVGFSDGVVRVLYRLPEGWKRVSTFKPHSQALTVLEYAPDGRLLATASPEGTIFLLRVPELGILLDTEYIPIGFLNPGQPVNSVAWRSDGKALLFTLGDGRIGEADLSAPTALTVDTSKSFEIHLPIRYYMFKPKPQIRKKAAEAEPPAEGAPPADAAATATLSATGEQKEPEVEEPPLVFSALQVSSLLHIVITSAA